VNLTLTGFNYIKHQILRISVILIPIFGSINNLALYASLLIVFLYFNWKEHTPYLFYLSLFLYKYISPQFFLADKGVLNIISLLFASFYTLKFLNFKYEFKTILFSFNILLLYLFLNAFFFSSLPFLSINKSINFGIYFISILYITRKYFEHLFEFLITLSYLLVITSFILVVMGLGNYSSLNLHCGILNQSQAYGYIMAVLLAFQLLNIRLSKNKKLDLLILIGSVVFLFLSKSRTAYFVVLLDLFILAFFLKGYSKYRAVLLSGIAFLVLYSLMFDNSFIENLFDKRNKQVSYKVSSSFDEMYNSRLQLAGPSMNNFYNNLAFGIGMGVPSEITSNSFDFTDRWGITYLPYTKIIISYPVEKGVQYTAILEELGLFGMLFFIFFILSFFPVLNNEIAYYSLIAIFTVLFISIGEASFFSPNGLGFFALFLLASSKMFILPIEKAKNTSYL